MWSPKCLAVLVLVAAIFGASVCAKPKPEKGKGKIKVKLESQEDTHGDDMDALKQKVDELKQRLDDLDTSKGECSGGKVHMYFHSGEEKHKHSDDDQHVHVHLHDDDHHDDDHEHLAVAHFDDATSGTHGHIQVRQKTGDKGASFFVEFDNVGAAGSYAMHVHEYGDVGHNCQNVGPHFNPTKDDKDDGDLGHVTAQADGSVEGHWVNNTALTLFGSNSIVGRSIVVHNPDGSKLSCAVIGRIADSDSSPHDDDHHGHHGHDHHDDRRR
ncbi:zinc transporter zipt-7.2-like [Dreissena polymorpha]|uniref:Superoxide dismutase copper/zinc binding domain-containing protein n=1 Tax=Dreissena polymorpha TaxID=45954 RepID=A0A9D4JL19_DREPO|nr:zinc transporter zipt-7.2-like [Dreissena polymorpha]KAH3816231.1 hypothetical protein DPMN_117744 [Dreissena polymorpha]